jgi:hypothetical protein
MNSRRLFFMGAAYVALFCLILIGSADGRALYDIDPRPLPTAKAATDAPYVMLGAHKIGQIGLSITNQGHFGKGFIPGVSDPFSGGQAPSCIYPYPSVMNYLFAGSFWIGAVVGRDTLVSVGADGWHGTMELWPDPEPRGKIIMRSLSNPDDVDAVSEQDFIAMYTDTLTDPNYVTQGPLDNRPHIPLGIEITQKSYAWSYSYADDFVLFDYRIKNIGRKELKNVYMGIYVDGDVGKEGTYDDAQDDICGFKREIPSPQGCGFIDTINIAWIADNNGKYGEEPCPYNNNSITSVTGVRVVRTPEDTLKYSFNWWVSHSSPNLDFGPRQRGTLDDPFRDFGGFLGTPEGDRNKYYIMRHEEFDYDQLFSAIDHSDEGWLPPVPLSNDIANGYDTRYLLSFGPFDISPGEVLPLSFAYVAGEHFHTDCDAFSTIFDPLDPTPYYETFSFKEFGENATWASWIYDNPGVDTDNDGYRGKKRYCVNDSEWVADTITVDSIVEHWIYTDVDTIYYEGDGIPDFVGASPPPPPQMWRISMNGDTLGSKIIPRLTENNLGELKVRWNGYRTETTPDRFSNDYDFEGYRVYLAISPDPRSFSLVASYDKDDYNRHIWNPIAQIWQVTEIPFTLDSLKKIYGEDFNPDYYSIPEAMYSWQGNLYYFTQEDWNNSDLTDMDGIHKVYPEEPPPTALSLDSARLLYPEELTEDGLFFKYYEYEFTIKLLLPSQLYYVAVTSFDFGAPGSKLTSLENPPSRNFVAEYAANDNSTVVEKGLNVIVYPNPYKITGNYRDIGFEGRNIIDGVFSGYAVIQEDLPDERVRAIHFLNLPNKCTIKIYTIDGDLVRTIEHDYPKDSPRSMHEKWDLITRNTQMVVSGIYYYTVESAYGNQVGKLVIIM